MYKKKILAISIAHFSPGSERYFRFLRNSFTNSLIGYNFRRQKDCLTKSADHFATRKGSTTNIAR